MYKKGDTIVINGKESHTLLNVTDGRLFWKNEKTGSYGLHIPVQLPEGFEIESAGTYKIIQAGE